MRLISRRSEHGLRLAIVLNDQTSVDVSDLDPDLPSTMAAMVALQEDPEEALDRLYQAIAGSPPDIQRRPLVDIDLAAPVGRIGKILAVGRNYREHAQEEGSAAPASPLIFAKYPSAVVGPEAEIRWRISDASMVDWEAELAVVIGRRARDVSVESARRHVLGYTCLNDVSARDLQFSDGQWTRGKSLDSFCPIGPWLVTVDEVPDPQALRLRCYVNGVAVQDASTADMIHTVDELIAFCSRFMTLDPGDIIATGTPGGVGAFRDPPQYLSDGDEVVVDIDGIGRLRNRCSVLPERSLAR